MPQKWETRPHAYSEGKTRARDEQHMDERLQTRPEKAAEDAVDSAGLSSAGPR